MRRSFIAAALLALACASCNKKESPPAAKTDPQPAATSVVAVEEKRADPPAPKPAVPEISTAIAIGNVKAEVEDALAEDGKKSIDVSFEATLKEAVGSDDHVLVRFACQTAADAKAKRLVAFAMALGVSPGKMTVGDTKKGNVAAWVMEPLDGAPTSCDLAFSVAELLGDHEKKLADFCFVPPKQVKAGSCTVPARPPAAADGPPVAIDAVSATVESAIGKEGEKYVRVGFDATARRALADDDSIAVHFACELDGKRMVDKGRALDLRLTKLAPFETMRGNAAAWALGGLEKAPSRCTLELFVEPLLGDGGTKVATYCFTPPKDVKPGACAK